MAEEMAEARQKVAHCLAHMQNRALASALRSWAAATARRRYCRAVLGAAVARLQGGQLAAAFTGWRASAATHARLHASAKQVC